MKARDLIDMLYGFEEDDEVEILASHDRRFVIDDVRYYGGSGLIDIEVVEKE